MVRLFARIVEYQLAERFVLARGSETVCRLIEVQFECDSVVGHGEGAPIARYDETVEASLAFLERYAYDIPDDPAAIDGLCDRLAELGPQQRAGRAAVDAAVHDWRARRSGIPVWTMLGLDRRGPLTTFTISLADPDEMAQRAELAATRFRRLKLKLGGLDGADLERVRAVRRATKVPLVVDVNEYWSFDEALELLPAVAELGVEACEQPLLAGHLDAPDLKRRSPIPLVADEDCLGVADVAAAATRAHGVNVKLSKAGGIRGALEVIREARLHGLSVTIGCMNESSLGIAAACQIASLCDAADLDGNLLLMNDPWSGVVLCNGLQLPADSPGLGVIRTSGQT